MDYDDDHILDSLSIDEDCQVFEGMNNVALAIEETKKKRAKVPIKDQTFRLIVEAP